MSGVPLTVYSSGHSFDHVVLCGLSLAEWLDRVEQHLARAANRPACSVNRSTLQADVLASAVLAMRNVEDIEGNEGELAHQVHWALQKTYECWTRRPPPEPYFKSRLLERDPSAGRAYCGEFSKLGPEQRKTIDSIVDAFLEAYHELAATAEDSGRALN
jgi:hypothetical protein